MTEGKAQQVVFAAAVVEVGVLIYQRGVKGGAPKTVASKKGVQYGLSIGKQLGAIALAAVIFSLIAIVSPEVATGLAVLTGVAFSVSNTPSMKGTK